MVIWSRLLSDVATRPLDAILQPENTMLMTRPLPPFSSHNSAGNSISPASPELSVPSLKQQVQIQDQATTPPLSPIEKIVTSSTTNTGVSPPVNDNDLHPPALPVMARIIPPPQSPSDLNESNTLKPKLYSPQLNI
jgi:hypothetical protein